ncbi:DNA replication protein [Tulasnella sp. 424]|nr:DNA replication protein [Tulasnella sp. 424]
MLNAAAIEISEEDVVDVPAVAWTLAKYANTDTEQGPHPVRKMDTDYYSIDSILAENHKIQCTFKIDVPGLGYIDGGNEKDIKAGTKMLLPYWLAPTLSLQDWVDVEIPQPFGAKVKRALAADARSVKLSNLVGGTGTWYGFGKMMADL